jgi:hypothetical protein
MKNSIFRFSIEPGHKPQISVDGARLSNVRSVTLRAQAGGLSTVTVEMAPDQFDVELPAELLRVPTQVECVFCHAIVPSASADQVRAHVAACQAHPIRAVEVALTNSDKLLGEARRRIEVMSNQCGALSKRLVEIDLPAGARGVPPLAIDLTDQVREQLGDQAAQLAKVEVVHTDPEGRGKHTHVGLRTTFGTDAGVVMLGAPIELPPIVVSDRSGMPVAKVAQMIPIESLPRLLLPPSLSVVVPLPLEMCGSCQHPVHAYERCEGHGEGHSGQCPCSDIPF